MTSSVARMAISTLFSSLLFASTAIAEEVTSIDRFQLWNKCRPVNLVVEHSLSEERITIAVRSKLRAARLYDADAQTWLHIREYGASLTTGVTAQYTKELTDTISGESAWMITWSRIREGVLVGVGFTLESSSQLTDEFIDEYLRVNADACKNK